MLRTIPRAPIKVTVGEIAARLLDSGFAVSRRTVERDLHNLSRQFPLHLDDRAKPYGWSWAKNANFEFTPRLTPSQAVALLLAQAHLQNLMPVSLRKELSPVFESAKNVLASTGWRDWHNRTAVLPAAFCLIPPKISADVMEVVQQALARRKCLDARYRSKGAGESKHLKIHPLGLLARGSVLYLVCTLFDYGDVRQLALHRLSRPVELAHARQEPPGFDFKSYVAGSGSKLMQNGRVRLLCHFDAPAAEHLRETPISSDQTWIQFADKQRVEVCATVEDDAQLRWWLLAFGSQINVIEPASIRQWIIAELEAASFNYRAGD